MGRSVPCEGQLDHIRIEHDGQALTCQPETILLKACADSACDSLYTDPVAVDLTSPVTGWDPDPVTLSGGQAEVNLRHTSAGTVSLDASATSPTADNATRCFVGGTESCQLTFHESGFIFDVPTQTACKPSADVTIQAVKESDDGVSCAPAFSGDRTVDFWSGYSDPAGGTESVFIDGNNDSNKAIAGSAPGTGIALTFDDNAEATFRVTYDDAGQVLLNARYDGSGDEAGLVLTGNDLFTGTPAGLAVYATEADNACPTADPADASCTPFKAAGESFDLNVKAACWSHAGDTDLSDNPATPNFELAGIGMDHTLIAPAGGSAGSIGVTGFDMTTADNGLKTLAQTVSEVGVFTFTATPPTYFGETIPAATSPRIGRFTPDHFEVGGFVEGQLEHGCNGTVFTYSGQAIDNGSGPYLTAPRFRITAMGPAGATVNYRDGFALLSAGDVAVSAPTEDADQLGADGTSPVTVTSSLATGTLVDDGPDTGADDGVLEYSASASDAFTYDHDANARVTPFTADLDLEITGIEDPDGVAATGLPRSMRATGTEIRFGRVAIYNAYGSELQALDLPLAVEHYQDLGGSDGFGVNSADTCTVLGTGDLGLNDHAGNLAPGDTSIAGVSLSAGEGTVTLSAPGDGNDGEVDVEAQLGPAGLPWLQYDWDDDGDYTDDPKDPEGHATFGIYGDDQNRIYLRERY